MDYGEADKILGGVAAALRQERERQGLSLQQLGAMSGVSRTGIAMIEKGERSPTLIICLRVADALGVVLGDVLNEAAAQAGRKRG
jgi:transcriptional regulator with XRE-family HTH domain